MASNRPGTATKRLPPACSAPELAERLQEAAQQGLHLVHRRLHRLHPRARGARADGAAAELDRLHLPDRDGAALCRHRRHEPDLGRRRVLRRRATRAGDVQRHGDRRRLDERGLVHRHGRDALSHGLRRAGLHPRLDRRLRAGGAVPGAVPAQVRPVHDPGLPRRPLRGQPAALPRHHRRDPVLVHLRRGADLRRRPDHGAALGPRLRVRDLRRPGRHPGLLLPRRHARGHLDAGRAVHHPDHRLHDPGRLALRQADRRAGPAGDLRLPAREGHQARRRAAQRSEGARGRGHLQGARGRVRRQAEERARGDGGRQGGGREEARRPAGRQCAGRRGRGGREGARRRCRPTRPTRARRTPQARRPTPRAPRRSAACRTMRRSTPAIRTARRPSRRPTTSRAATSSPSSSA